MTRRVLRRRLGSGLVTFQGHLASRLLWSQRLARSCSQQEGSPLRSQQSRRECHWLSQRSLVVLMGRRSATVARFSCPSWTFVVSTLRCSNVSQTRSAPTLQQGGGGFYTRQLRVSRRQLGHSSLCFPNAFCGHLLGVGA